jgi:hypothetical protein
LEIGRGGSGELEVAKSIVAISSVFEVGFPQEEQKRASPNNSAPQLEHLDMTISRYSLTQMHFRPQVAG